MDYSVILVAIFVITGMFYTWFQYHHGKANLSDRELLERYLTLVRLRRNSMLTKRLSSYSYLEGLPKRVEGFSSVDHIGALIKNAKVIKMLTTPIVSNHVETDEDMVRFKGHVDKVLAQTNIQNTLRALANKEVINE